MSKGLRKDDPHRTLDGLALAQTLYWEGKQPSSADIGKALRFHDDRRNDFFIFNISDGCVRLREKPAHYAPGEIEQGINTHSRRANLYRSFLEAVVREAGLDISCSFGMPMHDKPIYDHIVPLFAYQKECGSHPVLLPDVDTLGNNFYEDRFDDVLSYDEKDDSAVFVGATTGERHSMESVSNLSNDRLRLGVYFRDCREVDFRLPKIIQCESEDVKSAIRRLGFGKGAIDWPEQLKHKFLISIDGNGATCSRVAIALKSNSVLLKLNSVNVLHYFSAMTQYQHYIPFQSGEEVINIVRAEERARGSCSEIAGAGRTFFDTYIARQPTMKYTELLLRRYASLLKRETAVNIRMEEASQAPSPGSEHIRVRLSATVHVAGLGDRYFDGRNWIGNHQSRRAIEGFQLDFLSHLDGMDIQYKVTSGSPEVSELRSGDEFAGSRGASRKVHAISFGLLGNAAKKYHCSVTCAFVDGLEVGPFADGREFRSLSGAALEAFRIWFSRKPEQVGAVEEHQALEMTVGA